MENNLRSSGIGSFIGVLPAEGGTVASLIGYSEAKRWSKNQRILVRGSIEGIAGAEAANNAATGGAMVPTLALGIPGSATTAVILTGLIIHGVRPGPDLFREQPEFLYGIFGSMLIANILFFIFGFFGAKLFARITLVPNKILWPMIFDCISLWNLFSKSIYNRCMDNAFLWSSRFFYEKIWIFCCACYNWINFR